MSPHEITRESLAEAMHAHRVLCELGFDPAAIRVQLGRTSDPAQSLFPERTVQYQACVYVGLMMPDGRSWRACVGPVISDSSEFLREMMGLLDGQRCTNALDELVAYERSRARASLTEFAASIRGKGIQIPSEEKT